MHWALALLFGALILIADTPALPADVAGGKTLVVIVHPARKVQLNLEEVARIYLKKRRFWNDGQPIVALNQAPGSPARENFSQLAFESESTRLGTYWNEQYFHGVLPPVALSSPASVKRYVASDPNAIGYIELSDVDDSVRVAFQIE
jgi:ABC-type phosphate transport system substrate-binding protein